jgi:hypothetical protein
MFCRVKKARFDLTATTVNGKYKLKTKIILPHKCIDVDTDIYEASTAIRSIHKDKQDFLFLVESEYIKEFRFCSETSRADALNFLYITADGFDFKIQLTPENFAIDLDLELENYPEVIYLGQSVNMLNRLQSHKTLHKAVSQLADDEEIMIYLLTFKYGVGGISKLVNPNSETFNTWLRHDKSSKNYLNRISLIERTLIYFFKPMFNIQHVRAKINQDVLVKQLLIKNKVDSVSIGVGMYGKPFQFWSRHQPTPYEVSTFDFRCPALGFQEGLPNMSE